MPLKRKRLDNLVSDEVLSWYGSTTDALSYENTPSTGVPVLNHRQNYRTIEVSPEFSNTGFFKCSTLNTAIDNMLTLSPPLSATYPGCIVMHCGVHSLTTGVVIPAFVSIRGASGIFNTTLSMVNSSPTSYMIQLTDNNELANLVLACNLNVDNAVECGPIHTASHCKFTMALNYNKVAYKNFSANLNSRLLGTGPIGASGSGVPNYVFDGSGLGNFFDIANFACNGGYGLVRATNGAKFEGASFFCFQAAGPAVRAEGTAGAVWISGGSFQGCTGSIFSATDSGSITAQACTLYKTTNTGKTFECLADTAEISLSACNMPSTLLHASVHFPPGGNSSNAVMATTTNSDINTTKGFKIIGNLVVGTQEFGNSSYFGTGGPYQSLMNVIDYLPNTTTLDVNWTASSRIQFENLSDHKMPNTNNINAYTVISESVAPFYAFVYKVTQNATRPMDSYVVEYLGSGAVWTKTKFTVSMFDPPYSNYGAQIFPDGNVTGKLVCRLDFDTMNPFVAWTKQTFSSSGTRYHLRIRQVAVVPTSGYITSLYTLNNVTSIDNFGYSRYYGRARAYVPISFDINTFQTAGAAPQNQDLYFSSQISVGRTSNKFAVGDKVGLTMFLPPDLDNSSALRLSVAYCSSSNTASQNAFTLQIFFGKLFRGSAVYFSTPGLTTVTDEAAQIETLPLDPSNGTRLTVKDMDIYVPTINTRDPGGRNAELMCMTIQRIAGSPTNANLLVFVQFGISYLRGYSGVPQI